jgi:hypothetical protein
MMPMGSYSKPNENMSRVPVSQGKSFLSDTEAESLTSQTHIDVIFFFRDRILNTSLGFPDPPSDMKFFFRFFVPLLLLIFCLSVSIRGQIF